MSFQATDVQTRLDEIAKAIKDGQSHEKFTKELDRLLGTEMEERDSEVEARWEASYNGQKDCPSRGDD